MKLYRSVRQAYDVSPYAGDEAAGDFMFEICKEACGRLEMVPSLPLGEALYSCAGRLLVDDGSLHGFPDESVLQELTLEEGSRLRTYPQSRVSPVSFRFDSFREVNSRSLLR